MTNDPEIISSGVPHQVHLPEGSKTAVHKTAAPSEPQVRNTLANPDEEVAVEVVEVVKSVSPSQEDATRLARGTPAAAREADRFLNVETAERPDHMVSVESAQETPGHAPTHALPLSQVMSDLPSLDLPATEETFAATVGFAASAPQEPGAPSSSAQEVAAQADIESPSIEVVAQADKEAAPGEVVAQADAEAVLAEAGVKAGADVAPANVVAPAQFMEEMNFPARVVKLKMANDQVRGQIEKLEKPLFPPIPVEAPAAPKGKGKEPAAKPAKGH